MVDLIKPDQLMLPVLSSDYRLYDFAILSRDEGTDPINAGDDRDFISVGGILMSLFV